MFSAHANPKNSGLYAPFVQREQSGTCSHTCACHVSKSKAKKYNTQLLGSGGMDPHIL